MYIREATPEDNNQLLDLTSQTPMQGFLSLRIDRNPDFFSLLELRGASVTLIAEYDKKILSLYLSKPIDNQTYLSEFNNLYEILKEKHFN